MDTGRNTVNNSQKVSWVVLQKGGSLKEGSLEEENSTRRRGRSGSLRRKDTCTEIPSVGGKQSTIMRMKETEEEGDLGAGSGLMGKKKNGGKGG